MRTHLQLRTDQPHILLRDLERSDAPAWYAYLQQPQTIEHTSWNLRDLQDLLPQFDLFASAEAGSQIRLAIVDERDGRLLGTIGFHTISVPNRSAELSYDLDPAYWGQGIVASAARALLTWAYSEMGWVRIQATVLPSNLASIRVLEKLGFEREGLLRSFRQVRGVAGDFLMYSRLAQDA